jgi:hypothetical protein
MTNSLGLFNMNKNDLFSRLDRQKCTAGRLKLKLYIVIRLSMNISGSEVNLNFKLIGTKNI